MPGYVIINKKMSEKNSCQNVQPYGMSKDFLILRHAMAQRDYEVATHEMQDIVHGFGHSITMFQAASKRLEAAFWNMQRTLPFNPSEEQVGHHICKESCVLRTRGLFFLSYQIFVGSTKFLLVLPNFCWGGSA